MIKNIDVARNKSLREYSKLVISIIMHKVFLDLIYLFWIKKYYGFNFFPLSYTRYSLIFVNVVFAIFSVFIAKLLLEDRADSLIVSIIFLMYYAPICSMCSFCDEKMSFFIFASLYFTIMIVSVIKLRRGIKFYLIRKKNASMCNQIFVCAAILSSFFIIFISGSYAKFNVSFNIAEYSDLRVQSKSYNIPLVFEYVYGWSINLMPIVFAVALIEKKKLLMLFSVIAQIFAFSFNGKKSVLFMFILVYILYKTYKREKRKQIPKFLSLFSIICIIDIVVMSGVSILSTLFIRRMMFIPAYLGGVYFDFFQKNQFDFLKSSFLRHFGFSTIYKQGIPDTIGKFMGNLGMHANTGMLGDAYANFGWFSLLAYPFLDALIISCINRSIQNVDYRISIVVCFLMSYTIVSGSIFSILLTNGIIIICILLSLYTTRRRLNIPV